MKFSVIVPIYNVERYLEQCIESILIQDYDDFELILVDDGSLDACPQMCDAYAQKDSRVRVIHKENGGSSDARNAGIRAANGEYLLFIDSDDYWNTDSVLTKIANVLTQHPVHLIQFGHEKFFQQENKILHGPNRTLSQYNGLASDAVIGALVENGKLTISAWSMAISRQFILDHQLFFLKGVKGEDIEWAVRLYTFEPTWAFIDEYFYIYRMQREGSVTATIDYSHLCDYCYVIEKSVAAVEKCSDGIRVPLMSYLMYHVLIASALVYRVKLNKSQRKEILARLRAVCKGRMHKYTLGKKVKMASLVYRIGGFTVMSKVLGFYLNHRGY